MSMVKSTTLGSWQDAMAADMDANGDRETNGQAAERDPITGELVDDVVENLAASLEDRHGLLPGEALGAAREILDPSDVESDALGQLHVIIERDDSIAQITDKITEAAHAAGLEPAESATRDAAERLWSEMGEPGDGPRQHQYTYSVDERGGVRDWRAYAPAREAASGSSTTNEGENAEPRFSGGGAGMRSGAVDDEISRLIPTDGAFLNEPYKDAPALANLAEKLIDEHGFFERLRNCRIDYVWERKGTNSKGKRSIGRLKRVSGPWRRYCKYQFVLSLSADTARLARFGDRQVEASLFHQLCHIDQDSKGNWIRVGHDFEGFGAEVRIFGPWTEDLKIGSQAFTKAVQPGLDPDAGCDADDPDPDDDEDDPDEDLADEDAADEDLEDRLEAALDGAGDDADADL
jgi:hypothetical protein